MNASVLFGAGWETDSLEVLWRDAGRAFCRLWRDDADGNRYVFIPVSAGAENPTLESVNRLAHEHQLRSYLDSSWALRPLELLRERGQTMLVVDYTGGEPLDRLIREPMEIGQFLRLSVALSEAVGQLHGRGVIHKDVKPANLLLDSATGRVRLTGFGIASRLPRERQPAEPPEFIAGTLAYMAPEQTGRVNRSIDSRSDLYSLGVTFYEMLTGSLPFTASDPMEWVHCHIARQPTAPSERLPNVPAALSAITMKLLSKTAEERYQTAAGVEHDLEYCLSQWESRGSIDVFPVGAQDTPDRLMIPEKLYGRDSEEDALLTAFDRTVAGGRPELVLVSGYSGIGKSAVVNELHKPLVPPRGLFASGKFDQYKRDIPYATLAQAFQSLVRPLLSKGEDELGKWRDALREALEPNGLLMVELVPELKHVIGEQPPVPELLPSEAQRRFQLVFRRFIAVFARPEHPLALFLDDLQWLDAATLDLLEDLLTRDDLIHLFLIGAYRDNEVSATHPLMRKLDAIRQAGAAVEEIVLTPLGEDDLRQLLADYSAHLDGSNRRTLLVAEGNLTGIAYAEVRSDHIDENTLVKSHFSSIIHAPIEQVDLPAWCFGLSEVEYQSCSPAHVSAAVTSAPDGRRMSINVEVLGGSPMVQHYVEEIAEPHHLRLVSNSDVFAPTGRIQVNVIWDLSVKKIDDNTCEFTNVVHSSFTPELLDSLAKQGIPRVFQASRKPVSEAHNCQETPLFAKSIDIIRGGK